MLKLSSFFPFFPFYSSCEKATVFGKSCENVSGITYLERFLNASLLRRNLHHMVDKKLEFDIQIKQPSTKLKQIRYHERFHLFSTSWRSTVVYSSIF